MVAALNFHRVPVHEDFPRFVVMRVSMWGSYYRTGPYIDFLHVEDSNLGQLLYTFPFRFRPWGF